MIKMKNEASSEQELKEIGYGQLMAEHAFHGTVLVDSSRTIVAYNPTAAELFANTLGEKIQKGVSFTQLFPPRPSCRYYRLLCLRRAGNLYCCL